MNLKFHTPQGVMDYLPDECMAKQDLQTRLSDTFTGYAYRHVSTPTFEYYDIYSGYSGDISPEKLYKFFDAQGRILALRGDITTSIARMMATKWGDNPLPARLCYVADAFRYDGSASALSSEFTQAGIELIGDGSPNADAEAIMVTISALKNAGLDEFQIDIGQVEFFKGLAEQIGLNAEDTERIREFIDHKDSLSIAEMAAGYHINEEIKGLLCDMPDLFGGVDVLTRAYSPCLNPRSKAALDNLKEVYNILSECGLEKYISLDLGMLQSLDYYTGIIFKGFTYDVGFAICGGGRYDSLIQNFGIAMEAVGVAIGVNRVLSALQRQKKPIPIPVTHALLYMGKDLAIGFAIGEKLRSSGLIVENYIGQDISSSFDHAMTYAISHDIAAVLMPTLGGGIAIHYTDGRRRVITENEIGGLQL